MLKYQINESMIEIETDHIQATIQTEGYVSGVMANSFLDKRTGCRDLGFGLSIADFLLEPATERATEPDQYHVAPEVPPHGNIYKRYVEGPQICTQAKKLPFEIIRGRNFLVVKQWYRFHQDYPPYKAGSRWEQILVFPESTRYFFSADRVTSVNDHPALFLRIDMPGHIKHTRGDSFSNIYLSYQGKVPSAEFAMGDFPPQAKFLYQRDPKHIPEMFIRGYQVRDNEGEPGPWLVGMTLNAEDVYQAWCHQRGYVCMIEEIGGRPVRAGQTFGACYCVGWFDHIEAMHSVYHTHRGWSGLTFTGPADKPSEYKGLTQEQLPAVREIAANP